MEIYLEDFIIQNSIINLCLLKLVELTTKSKTNLFKLILSSIVGSAFSVFSVSVFTNILLINCFKFTCSVIMLTFAFRQTKKQFIFNYILLYLYTYALGGLIIKLFGVNYYTNFGFIISNKISITSICFIVMFFTYIFKLALKHIPNLIKCNKFIYKIKLFKNNKSVEINAYLDTGNFLNYNGKPVIILDIKTYCKLAQINLIDFYLSKSEYIKTNTVNGSSNLKLFMLDKLELINNNKKHIFENQLVAINTNGNFKETNYQALLSPMLF